MSSSLILPTRLSVRLTPSVLAFALLTTFSVPAQNADTEQAAKVEFRVTRFDVNDRKSPVFRAGNGGRQIEIEVPLTFIAGPFEASLRDGVFLDLWQGAAEKPAISLKITPAEREHLLLVFFEQDQTFRVLKVVTPPARIKGGDRFIINATPNEMVIKLGSAKPLKIPPNKSGVLAAAPGSGIVSLPVLVSLKQEDAWKLATTEQWPIDPRFRKYLVAYISPRTRQLAFHSVMEPM
ncbi:MAG: hypothetical protein WED15_00900 [Akkermansiaceae bacterium]